METKKKLELDAGQNQHSRPLKTTIFRLARCQIFIKADSAQHRIDTLVQKTRSSYPYNEELRVICTKVSVCLRKLGSKYAISSKTGRSFNISVLVC